MTHNCTVYCYLDVTISVGVVVVVCVLVAILSLSVVIIIISGKIKKGKPVQCVNDNITFKTMIIIILLLQHTYIVMKYFFRFPRLLLIQSIPQGHTHQLIMTYHCREMRPMLQWREYRCREMRRMRV